MQTLAHEDYNKVSGDYSRVREPVGMDILLGCYSSRLGALSDKKLIDIGCGAGIYALPLSDFFGEVLGIDKSQGQIEQARNRQKENPDQFPGLKFEINDALALEVDDECFDAALVSLMLHHVRDEGNEKNSSDLQKQVVHEVFRVLKTGSILVFGLCSRAQVYDGAWYCSLVPARIPDARVKIHPDIEELINFCSGIGLKFEGRFVQTDKVLQGEQYFDRLGPLDESWRNADSLFSSLTKEEIRQFLEKMRKMEAVGSLKPFVDRHHEIRKGIGQVTFLKFSKL
jgi:SAM-dependent methyltransferase